MDIDETSGESAGSVRSTDSGASAQPGRESDGSRRNARHYTSAEVYFVDGEGVIWDYLTRSRRVPYNGPRPGEYQIFRDVEEVWRYRRG